MDKAYGGVIIDDQGLVLLREPKGHFGGYVWTFPKGRPEPGESPKQAALREIFEETGVYGTIVGKIPGAFAGSTTNNEYFLVIPSGCPENWPSETQTLRWVEQEEAKTLISTTNISAGKSRDLSVLESAYRTWQSLRKASPGLEKQHKFELGKNYTRAALKSVLGASEVGFLPVVDGRVVCGCVRRKYNPDAPDIILAGDNADIREQAIAFCYQKAAAPMFISTDPAEQEDSWEYVGDFAVESWTENQKEIALHKQRAPANKHISRIMFLRKVR
jgi:hypothetical protein